MSILAATKEISPSALAQKVFNLSSFKYISQEDYKLLLRYLVSIDHISKTESGKLILGLAGEKIVKRFQFYAVFPETIEFSVKHDSTDIGTIVIVPKVGSQFGLAGKTWEVLDVNFAKKTIFVKQVQGKAGIFWRGGNGTIHSKILERMRRVLLEDTEYVYLQTNAKKRLQEARQLASDFELDKRNIIKLEKGKCCIFPWMGTVAYNTFQRLLNNFCRESLEIKSLGGINPYFMILKLGKGKFEQLKPEILSLCEQRIVNEHLVADAEAPEIQKYDKFIPYPLLRIAFASDYLNMEEVRQQVALW